MGKRILLTGATGMVGGEVLKACLNNEEVVGIRSLVRRPSGIEHNKLEEIVVGDFCDLSELKDTFRDIDVAIYCLAAYQGKMSPEEYTRITVDYCKVFANALIKRSPDAVFCLFSAAGADSEEKSKMQFARDKGAAENYILNKGFIRAHAFRPAYIYPVVKREEPSKIYKVVRSIYPLLKVIYPGGVVTSEHLAKAMLEVGLHGGELSIYENRDIRKIQPD